MNNSIILAEETEIFDAELVIEDEPVVDAELVIENEPVVEAITPEWVLIVETFIAMLFLVAIIGAIYWGMTVAGIGAVIVTIPILLFILHATNKLC